MKNHITIFTDVYENKEWGDNNDLNYKGSSGGGSSINFNIEYINFLKNFIHKNKITKIIDLGCGDWQSSYLIYDNMNIEYYGYDAYEKVITSNKNKFPLYNFIHLDILNNIDCIQDGDLCILKDILQHWTNEEIYFFLDKLISLNKFKYIIINNSSAQLFDNQSEPLRSRPLSIKYLPLKKYNFVYLFSYNDKEVSLLQM